MFIGIMAFAIADGAGGLVPRSRHDHFDRALLDLIDADIIVPGVPRTCFS